MNNLSMTIIIVIIVAVVLLNFSDEIRSLEKKDLFKTFSIVALVVIVICGAYYLYQLPPSEVTVKYRENTVNVSKDNFEHLKLNDSTLKNAWYDQNERYLIVQLNNTNYHYCDVPSDIWGNLKSSSVPYSAYSSSLQGNFDCRAGHVPAY